MSPLLELICLEASRRENLRNYFIHGQLIIFVPLHLTLSSLFASHLLEDDKIFDAMFSIQPSSSNIRKAAFYLFTI